MRRRGAHADDGDETSATSAAIRPVACLRSTRTMPLGLHASAFSLILIRDAVATALTDHRELSEVEVVLSCSGSTKRCRPEAGRR